MISIFLASRLSNPKSGSSSSQIEGPGLLPLSHKLPVLPLEARIPLSINIMLRGLRVVQRVSTSKARNNIEWRYNENTIELVLNFNPEGRGTVYLLDEKVTFKEIIAKDYFSNTQIKFPKDFNQDTSLGEFLVHQETPLSIELRNHNRSAFLNNHACEPDTNAIIKGLNNRRGLLQAGNTEMDAGQTRDFLTQAYLRLQAEAYCRANNLSPKTELTANLREDLLNHLCHRNETNQQEVIDTIEVERLSHWEEIVASQQEIKEMEADADRLLRLYQWGAIGVTGLHLLGFGYMIFWVDWLGWDIIEPITFSVSCFYLLLSLRFYRKFRRDRNEQTIRDRFRELVLSPKKLMRLRAAQSNLQRQQEFQKEKELKLVIARNRLVPSTTLSNAILQS